MKNSGASSSDPKGKRPMIDTSEWETSIDDSCQNWLLQNIVPTSQLIFPTEDVSASFPTLVDAVPHGVSSSIPMESLYQNWFFGKPEPTFQLESTFQPEATFQPEPYEEGNRTPGKRPMSDSTTLSPNPISDAYYEVSASKRVEPIDTIMNHGPEFERLVEDSWAYICKLYSRKKGSAEVLSTKAQRNVRSRRPYQFVKPNTTLVVFGEEMDISDIPTPICSCTGISRTCRGWTSEGWISICCTADLSRYPLPTYVGKSRIVRLPGRRMGGGTFTKVIEKLLLEGYDLDYPIDLKDHWVKHGTNKYAVNK